MVAALSSDCRSYPCISIATSCQRINRHRSICMHLLPDSHSCTCCHRNVGRFGIKSRNLLIVQPRVCCGSRPPAAIMDGRTRTFGRYHTVLRLIISHKHNGVASYSRAFGSGTSTAKVRLRNTFSDCIPPRPFLLYLGIRANHCCRKFCELHPQRTCIHDSRNNLVGAGIMHRMLVAILDRPQNRTALRRCHIRGTEFGTKKHSACHMAITYIPESAGLCCPCGIRGMAQHDKFNSDIYLRKKTQRALTVKAQDVCHRHRSMSRL